MTNIKSSLVNCTRNCPRRIDFQQQQTPYIFITFQYISIKLFIFIYHIEVVGFPTTGVQFCPLFLIGSTWYILSMKTLVFFPPKKLVIVCLAFSAVLKSSGSMRHMGSFSLLSMIAPTCSLFTPKDLTFLNLNFIH